MSMQFKRNNIAQSVFAKNYEQLSESEKDILNQKYSCSICLQIIKYENPYLCYQCQKIFHHLCLKSWDNRQRQLNKVLSCPNCRNELPFEEWKVLKNFDENRTKDAEIINQLGKTFNSDAYINKSQNLYNLILNKLKDIHPLIEQQKSYKLNNLIEEFKSNIKFPEIDEISIAIIEELDLIKEYIENSKKGIIKEEIAYKNEINLKYKPNEEGNTEIFGEEFVENNKDNISLVINGKKSPLVSCCFLKKGENTVTMLIKKNLTNLSSMFYHCAALYNIEELKYLNTENVTDFSYIFRCTGISDVKPLENWNTSKAETFREMFCFCELLTNINPLNNWNVSKCKDFSGIFGYCENLSNIKPLESWNVSNGNDFSGVFKNWKNLTDIKILENWDVSNGTTFQEMFSRCESLSDIKPLEKWKVSKSISFEDIFQGCQLLEDIRPLEHWDVSNAII